MGISTNQVRFLALTTVQRNINISTVTETDISAKVDQLAEAYNSLLYNSNDLINPFAIGDAVTIGDKVSSILPDDAFIDENGMPMAVVPEEATISSIDGDNVYLQVGNNQVEVAIDDLTDATDKVMYTPEEFLSLTGNSALANINFDSSTYLNYSVDTTSETTIFAQVPEGAYSMATSVANSKSDSINVAMLGEEHSNINTVYNSTKAVINDDDKKMALAVMG